jgi:hypothetical protein
MFSWSEFCSAAHDSISPMAAQDDELNKLVSASSPPDRKVDEVGRPFANSSLIKEHPDPVNYRRIVSIRRKSAEDEGNCVYVDYSKQVEDFLDRFWPFSNTNPLFVIWIATHKDVYEFLYVPSKAHANGWRVGHLGNLRATDDKQ